MDIPLNYVRLGLISWIRPIANISNRSEQKNTLPLTATNLNNQYSYRFHNPHPLLIFVFFELLSKNGILAGQIVRERQIIIACSLLRFSLTFNCFFISFDIFGQQIFPTNFIEVSKMVDPLFRKQSYLIKRFSNIFFFTPIYIPIIILRLPIHAVGQAFLNAVRKVCLKLDFIAIC